MPQTSHQTTKTEQQQQQQQQGDHQQSFLDHLEFFNPERIIHHSQRHLHRITQHEHHTTEREEQEEEQVTEHDIWDRLHVEYAFSYSRKLIRLALNYLTSFRFLERTENAANQAAAAAAIVDNHTRIVALQ